MQQQTTQSSHATPRKAAIAALLAFGSMLAGLAPATASADASHSIRGASTIVLAATQHIGNQFVVNRALFQETPAPVPGRFVSQHLTDTLSSLIEDGIHLGKGRGKGNFYVHVESHGFGGILSIRYRR